MGKIQLVDRGPIRGPSPIEMTDFESSFEAPSLQRSKRKILSNYVGLGCQGI